MALPGPSSTTTSFLQLLVPLLLVVVPLVTATQQKQRPNIVFVLADDYGYYDIGYHGTQIKTPHLNKLCASGVRLENYYVQPICVPTRSQLMSGMYQIHTGLQHSNTARLPLTIPTVADKIKEAGYSTHMVGKWHLGFRRKENLPSYRGFDTTLVYVGGWETYYEHSRPWPDSEAKENYGNTAYLDLRTEKGPAFNYSGQYSANVFTDRAIQVVRDHVTIQEQRRGQGLEETPMFLYLAYQSVHTPLDVPEHYMEPYRHIKDIQRRKLAGMVNALDEGVGNLTDVLKSTGLWENTVFIFSTDNGGQHDGGGGSNWPLRGNKQTLWEGGMRANGFVTGGRTERSGVTSHGLIHVSDWFPTMVGLARGNLNGTHLDGYDQWSTINKGTESPRKVLLHNIDIAYSRLGKPVMNGTFDSSIRAAVRVGDYKLITGNPGDGKWVPPPGLDSEDLAGIEPATVTSSDEKTEDSEKNVWLFNIRKDPTERHDLSEKEPERLRQMLDQLLAFNKTAIPPYHIQWDPRSNPRLHGGVWGPWLP